VAEVAELREKVTPAWATAIMVGARIAWVDRMALEKTIPLASARGEADEVAQKISLLEGKLEVACQAWDGVEAKLSGMADWAAATDRRQEEVEGQCAHHIEELTLLRLRGSELCLTIVNAPSQDPLHEGMQFAVVRYTEVATQLATLWAAVSLTAQSVLGRLPAEVFQVDVVGVMVAMFWE
jgi:hypothetical protein